MVLQERYFTESRREMRKKERSNYGKLPMFNFPEKGTTVEIITPKKEKASNLKEKYPTIKKIWKSRKKTF